MQAYIEKEDSKKLKQKQRERMQPKMGKMDIDYQVCTVPWFVFRTLFPVYASSPKNDLCAVPFPSFHIYNEVIYSRC